MIDEPRQCCDVTPPLTANNIPLDSTPSDLPPVTNGSIEVRHWCADWARRWCGAGAERPPRATILEVCVSGVLSFVGIFALSLIHYVVSRSCSPCTELDTAQIVGSFGASAVLLFAAPKAPFSQPRNLLGGHLISALVGVGAYEGIAKPMDSVVVAAPIAVSVSIMLMHLSSTLHPPAGGTTLIAVVGSDRMHDLGLLWVVSPIMTSAVIILLVALLGNNFFDQRPYPQYWIGGTSLL